MSAQHTPGRLTVRGGYSIYTDDGKTPVADTCLTNSIPANDEANARRLVACWNACEGLDIDQLTNYGIGTATGSEIYKLHELQKDMLAALVVAREFISFERNAFTDCNGQPEGTFDADEAAELADYDGALLQINAAILKATGPAA